MTCMTTRTSAGCSSRPSVYLTLASALALLLGCSGDEQLVSGGLGPNDPADLAAVAGPCETGTTRDCYITLAQHDDVLQCYAGTQLCTDSVWGECTDGEIFEIPVSNVGQGGADGSNTQTQALSSATGCADNPCDPFCRVYMEVPDEPLTTEMTGSPYDWDTGSISTLSNLPGGFFDGGFNEPCQTGYDCQFNTYCYSPSPGACAHGVCEPGSGLTYECNDCVTIVCDQRPECCGRYEDGQVCGNGSVEGTETCDDGNTTAGDGCDANCLVECIDTAGGSGGVGGVGSGGAGAVPTEGVTGFTLIDADTDAVLAVHDPLLQGAELVLDNLPTNLNVRANVAGAVESVGFDYDGTTSTDNYGPYAMAGDVSGDYTPWTPSVGLHTISATAHSADGLGGTVVGSTQSITVNVVDSNSTGGGTTTTEITHVSSQTVTDNDTSTTRSVPISGGDSRMLLVGIAVEAGSTSGTVSSITYNGVAMQLAAQNVVGSSTTMHVHLYYLGESQLPTSSGDYDLEVTLGNEDGGVVYHIIELAGVADQAPQATATNGNTSGASSISTSLTTTTADSWVVDIVGSGNNIAGFTPTGGQTERGDSESDSMRAAAGTVLAASAGSTTLSWTANGSNRISHVLAAFAPALASSGGYTGGGVCDTADEGGSITLTCGAGEVIRAVNFASYGTPTGTCGSFSSSSCNASTSLSVVQGACLGRNACTVSANNATFGDACVGTVKRLYAEVTCAVPGSGGTTCGNSVLEMGENCDDGNQAPGDGCSSTCTIESCGDGTVQCGVPEECDDGNTVDGDGCSATCTYEDSGAGGAGGGGSSTVPYTCSHDPCVTGAALPSDCTACVGAICATSPGCCSDTAPSGDLIDADFGSGAEGFTYADDVFGTSEPDNMSGSATGGRLRVYNTGDDSDHQSGGWRETFTASGTVDVSFDYALDMENAFESHECGEVRVTIDGSYYGSGGNDYVVRHCNGGSESGTFTFTSASLGAGSHTLTIGAYLNHNSAENEDLTLDIDNVVVTGSSGAWDDTCVYEVQNTCGLTCECEPGQDERPAQAAGYATISHVDDDAEVDDGNGTRYWSYTISGNANRMLVVGVAVECNWGGSSTSITYDGVAMHEAEAELGGGYMQVRLFYLGESELPDAGSHYFYANVTDKMSGIVFHVLELSGVADEAPEATADDNDGGSGASTISTNITTATDGSRVVAFVGSGDDGASFSPTGSLVEHLETSRNSMRAALGTLDGGTAGAKTVAWNVSGSNRLAQVVAAFAPYQTPASDASCYDTSAGSATWTSARTACQALGTGWDLAKIESDDENDFLDGLISSDHWIGANDRSTEGSWEWTDGTSLAAYDNWNGGEPNNSGGEDCAEMYGWGVWNDVSCSQYQPSICEGPPSYMPRTYSTVCGNGTTEPPVEACDDGNTASGDGCSATCLNEYCGDSVVQSGIGEECDDGNSTSGDGCSATCQTEECGDGIVTCGAPLNEECDDGNTASEDGCSATCQAEYCGDGTVQAALGEQCDDGNPLPLDGCSDTCQVESLGTCGDGNLDVGEECDDGNTAPEDGCGPACVIESCGDSLVQPGLGEECDDGNTVANDGCAQNCIVEYCGDGILQFGIGEECDDGNSNPDDWCSGACQLEGCGDGVLQPGIGEECDDANNDNSDGCSSVCVVEYCGDGLTQCGMGETCDDGNTVSGDGCDANCHVESGDTSLWNFEGSGTYVPGSWTQACVDLAENSCTVRCDPDDPTNIEGLCLPWYPGITDDDCAGMDLSLGIPCETSIPVCNHGNTAAPAGITLVHWPEGSGQFPSCTPDQTQGSPQYCQTDTPIPPGECIDVTGCGFTDNREVMVNPPGPNDVEECSCMNNWGLYFYPTAQEPNLCGEPVCSGGTSVATLIAKPVDIIMIIDNSGSMQGEIRQVENRINEDFVQIIENSGLDYRVIMVTRYGDVDGVSAGSSRYPVCIRSPLGPDDCPDNRAQTVQGANNPPRFFHYSADIFSFDAWCRLLEGYDHSDKHELDPERWDYERRDWWTPLAPNGWGEWLREEAFKSFLVITDDDAVCTSRSAEDFLYGAPPFPADFDDNSEKYEDRTSDYGTAADGTTEAAEFDAALLALAPEQFGTATNRNYMWHSILGMRGKADGSAWQPNEAIQVAGCGTGSEGYGTSYQALSILTGGLRYAICDNDNFDVMFNAIAQSVVQTAAVSCDYALQNQGFFNPDTAVVKYTAGNGDETDLTYIADPTNDCVDNGWYYNNPADPTVLSLCPTACDTVRADTGARIWVEIGCTGAAVLTTHYESYLAECIEGAEQWSFLTWDAAIPNDGSRIEFRARTAMEEGQLASATWVDIATANVTNQVCTGDCTADLFDALGTPENRQPALELQIQIIPGTDRFNPPVLNSWDVTFSCPPDL